MPRIRTRPAYTLHRPSGQARVRINGTDHYLGPYESEASRDAYDELIRKWISGGDAREVHVSPGLEIVTDLFGRRLDIVAVPRQPHASSR